MKFLQTNGVKGVLKVHDGPHDEVTVEWKNSTININYIGDGNLRALIRSIWT